MDWRGRRPVLSAPPTSKDTPADEHTRDATNLDFLRLRPELGWSPVFTGRVCPFSIQGRRVIPSPQVQIRAQASAQNELRIQGGRFSRRLQLGPGLVPPSSWSLSPCVGPKSTVAPKVAKCPGPGGDSQETSPMRDKSSRLEKRASWLFGVTSFQNRTRVLTICQSFDSAGAMVPSCRAVGRSRDHGVGKIEPASECT